MRGFDSRRRRSIFQSTLSMRRATTGDTLDGYQLKFQSTLSMRRATNTSDISDLKA